MNKTLLRKIKAHILAEPKRLDMGSWGYKRAKSKDGPACGTVGCIAGWAVLLDNPKLIKVRSPLGIFREAMDDVAEKALTLLKIDNIEAMKLFHVENWPEQFSTRYTNDPDLKARAQVTADRIDYFIKHGE